jgi:Na+/H+ antiporter NhaD/arsenite permease-like protein
MLRKTSGFFILSEISGPKRYMLTDIILTLPFASLISFIALAPLFAPKWWEKHYAKISLGLGFMMLAYYLFIEQEPEPVLHSLHEYFSFIVLIGSLFVVSGGISIVTKDQTNPLENVLFLFSGAVIANLVGTTGASMLFIRPWIRMNKQRISAYHIVFFIFIISNVGGSLTPIGDPPLFLGFLKGIPFFWLITKTFPMWCVGVGLLLLVFYFIDRRNFQRLPVKEKRLINKTEEWKFEGAANILFLLIILAAVFITTYPLLREMVILTAAAASYVTTKKSIHQFNHFSFHPIQEVAILFAGIFITMIPALQILQQHAKTMSDLTPAFFYWNAGILSSILDNAPTYLSFFSVAVGNVQTNNEPVSVLLMSGQFKNYIIAISIGSVFFGANTYIGNGPNFMVKSIAEHYHVPMPSFLHFITRYTLPIMLPMLAVIWYLFFT